MQEIHISVYNSQKDIKKLLLLLSDIHFDNPHCNRDLLKKDLDKALEDDAGICIFGDLFCCMHGAIMTPGKVKGNLLPQHDGTNYFDLVVEEAVEWWRPYANNLILVCPGNHETAVMKRQEIDLIDRFTTMLRMVEPDCNVSAGGYGNWMRVYCRQCMVRRNSFTIYSHHGYGSGGAFSQQITAFQKYFLQCDADVYIAGHIHKKDAFPYHEIRSTLKQSRCSLRLSKDRYDSLRHIQG